MFKLRWITLPPFPLAASTGAPQTGLCQGERVSGTTDEQGPSESEKRRDQPVGDQETSQRMAVERQRIACGSGSEAASSFYRCHWST